MAAVAYKRREHVFRGRIISDEPTIIRTNPEEDLNVVDRLSNLPDSVLCHILSFLPTKDVVATSVLSNRWRSLWTSVSTLDFNDSALDLFDSGAIENDQKRFPSIVNRVLLLTEPQPIQSFRLGCKFSICDPLDANSWVCTAVARHVQQLRLSLNLSGTFKLPSTLFTCQTIVVLELYGHIDLNVPSSVHLPSLKKLSLTRVTYADKDDAFQMLLSGCPVLEDVFVDTEFNLAWETCPVTLKKLSIEFSRYYRSNPQTLDISSSSLRYFALSGSLQGDNYHLGHLDSLVEAKLNIWADGDYAHDLVRLLGNLCHVKFLSLYRFTIKSLCGASNLVLPEFHNLHCVELHQCCNLHFVVNLLQNCRKLEVLIIDTISLPEYELCWKQPTSVPDCLSSHLIKCEYRGYGGFDIQLEFATYMLKNASVLKTMEIHTDGRFLESEAKPHIFKELSMLPRRSSTCQLVFG